MDARPRKAVTDAERLEEASRLFNWSTEPEVIDRAIRQMAEAESRLADGPTPGS